MSGKTRLPQCEECNIKFIGPDSETIDKMGNKSNARELMISAGVPVIPGDGLLTTSKAYETADRLGYPVMVKSVGRRRWKSIE